MIQLIMCIFYNYSCLSVCRAICFENSPKMLLSMDSASYIKCYIIFAYNLNTISLFKSLQIPNTMIVNAMKIIVIL